MWVLSDTCIVGIIVTEMDFTIVANFIRIADNKYSGYRIDKRKERRKQEGRVIELRYRKIMIEFALTLIGFFLLGIALKTRSIVFGTLGAWLIVGTVYYNRYRLAKEAKKQGKNML